MFGEYISMFKLTVIPCWNFPYHNFFGTTFFSSYNLWDKIIILCSQSSFHCSDPPWHQPCTFMTQNRRLSKCSLFQCLRSRSKTTRHRGFASRACIHQGRQFLWIQSQISLFLLHKKEYLALKLIQTGNPGIH